MKKVIFMAVVMLSSVSAFAQHAVGSLTIQPKVGINLADLTEYDDTDLRIGLAAGAELEYQATDAFSISGGLLYSMQGAKYETHNATTTTKLDYLNVPIMANVYIAKGFAVKLGVQPGFKLNAKNKAEVNGTSVETDMDHVKSVDFSIPVGISYEVSNIVFDARYNWGLTKFADTIDDKSHCNSVVQFTVGYKFGL